MRLVRSVACALALPAAAAAAAAAVAAVAAVAATAASVSAQEAAVPHREWRTLRTEHFRVHYPTELERWALDVGGRLEGVRVEVGNLVGYTPPQVIDVIIEDPLNTTNGSAWPRLSGPVMRFWPIPPDPGVLGDYRDWGELLAVHEYAHLAHLLRPTRNRWRGWVFGASPVPFGPLAAKVPGWVAEGYATVVEGRLTGSGRPNGVQRPAILRQWALEGALPSYDRLDATGPFQGGAMRYLVGSAFLEWLVEREGWESLDALWRRLSAKTNRAFEAAFVGVYGDRPAALYGQFVAEVTAQAKRADAELRAQGLAEGTLVQRLAWSTGAPTVAPDTHRLALRRATPSTAPRVFVWADSAKAETEKSRKAKERAAKRDPEDVPAKEFYPPPLHRLQQLTPRHGSGFSDPRFLPGGQRLLVVRGSTRGDGTVLPDLWEWEPAGDRLRRITRNAGIRLADPFPDGRTAAAIRCADGSCDLVRVDLGSGEVTTIVAGTLSSPFAGVRVSPDGARIATARRTPSAWEVVLVDARSGAVTRVSPGDGASRYDPAWLPDGRGLVVVSEASGTPQLERLDLADATVRPLTRSATIVRSPDVGPDGRVWFLALHARGWDLRVTYADSTRAPAPRVLVEALAPVAPRRVTEHAKDFPSTPIAPRPYRSGPIGINWFPTGGRPIDGEQQGAALLFNDPVGRVGGIIHGALGDPGTWSGGALAVTWRGVRPALTAQLWGARHDPSRQPVLPVRSDAFDIDYHGGSLVAEWRGVLRAVELTTRLGASAGRLRASNTSGSGVSVEFIEGRRHLATFGTDARMTFSPNGRALLTPELRVDASAGRTQDIAWQRTVAEAGLTMRPWGKPGLRAVGTYGVVNADAPRFERFAFGGGPSMLAPQQLFSQRFVQPAFNFASREGRVMSRLRVENTGPVQLYHEWYASGDDRPEAWRRLAGIEGGFTIPPWPGVRIPGLSVRVGAAAPTDGPRQGKVTAYSFLVLTP